MSFGRVGAEYGGILVDAMQRLCGELSEEVLDHLLDSIEIIDIGVGGMLYHQGEAGNCMHVLLTGRLQVEVNLPGGRTQVVAYLQPGEIAGEMSLLSGSPRAATVLAVRESRLGVIYRETLDLLAAHNPQVFSHIMRMIIARLGGAQAPATNPRSVMVVPLHEGVDAASFSHALRMAMLPFGSVIQLDAEVAAGRFGIHADSDYARFFDACERDHDFVLLMAGNEPDGWARKCASYADRIVLVADASQRPALTRIEEWLFDEGNRGGYFAEVELVLLHGDVALPANTGDWLAERAVARHFHVRTGERSDMGRLARFLTNNAVSLVLAGGGARGFAHLGVIRALHEVGVPVDAVGGASFGALAATGLARGIPNEVFLEELRVAFSRDDPLGDYTLPVISLVRGEHLSRVLARHLPMDIRDLWLPFFAVSSDLSADKVRVHEQGEVWRAIRASVSLPAILPPALEGGHMLVDGGVLNNLPVDVMRSRIRGKYIAVDLSVREEFRLEKDEIPSTAEFIKSRLLPGRKKVSAPTLSRVIMKATTMASLKEVQSAGRRADLYLNPPLGAYDFLDWGRLREIVDVGYQYALPLVRDWAARNPALVQRHALVATWQSGVRAA